MIEQFYLTYRDPNRYYQSGSDGLVSYPEHSFGRVLYPSAEMDLALSTSQPTRWLHGW